MVSAMTMTGSIRKRGTASWELRVYAGTDPETGRRRYQTKTVRGNRADAERELAALVARVAAIRATGSASSMGELLEAWFATAAVSWAPTTIRQTRSVIDRYLLPGLGNVRIGDVTPAMIDALYAGLAENGGERGQGLSSGTLARANVVLRAALGQAMRWGWIWENPAISAHRIVVAPREMAPPTPTELGVLFDYLRDREPQLYVFVVLAAMTGARRAQVLGLRWENLNFESMRVSFRSGWVEGPNGPVLAATKTKRSHVVDLDPATFAVVAELGQCRSGFVFSDDGGVTAWKPNRVTKAFIRCRRRAGLREFRLHDLRHFMATEMLEAGVSIAVVSKRLDHRRVSTTLDRYSHAVPGGDSAASVTLRAVIDKPSTAAQDHRQAG